MGKVPVLVEEDILLISLSVCFFFFWLRPHLPLSPNLDNPCTQHLNLHSFCDIHSFISQLDPLHTVYLTGIDLCSHASHSLIYHIPSFSSSRTMIFFPTTTMIVLISLSSSRGFFITCQCMNPKFKILPSNEPNS